MLYVQALLILRCITNIKVKTFKLENTEVRVTVLALCTSPHYTLSTYTIQFVTTDNRLCEGRQIDEEPILDHLANNNF